MIEGNNYCIRKNDQRFLSLIFKKVEKSCKHLHRPKRLRKMFFNHLQIIMLNKCLCLGMLNKCLCLGGKEGVRERGERQEAGRKRAERERETSLTR